MQTTSALRSIDAILLDMDGTILNPIRTAERIWGAWAQRQGIDVESFVPTIHGVQSIETIRRLGLAGIDPATEAAMITKAEIDDVEGIDAIAGAAAFLSALPNTRWAIVTSAPRALALRRIEAAGLPAPPLLIAAEDVARGKPAPDCFHLAAGMLGTTAAKCLVIEDSVAGVASAASAGATVLVVTATHHKAMETQHATIKDYRDLVLHRLPNGAIAIDHDDAAIAPAFRVACVLQAAA